MHKIMTYGTLMSNFGNNRLLQNKGCRLIGRCITVDPFILMDFGGFPGLFPPEAGRTRDEVAIPVQGELWEIDDATLARCDSLEGHPRWYRRTPIRVYPWEQACLDVRKVYDCEVYMQWQGKTHGTYCEDGAWPRTTKLQHA